LPWFESEFQYLFIWLQNFKQSKLFTSIMSKFEVWDQKSKGVVIKW